MQIEQYRQRIFFIHRTLGIPENYVRNNRLPLQIEATNLMAAGQDIFKRPQQLTHQALNGWLAMRTAAAKDGVQLAMVSAFRSVDYQCQLIKRKLERGQSLEQILTVNAAPGYSEHHTGRALDLTTSDCQPLTEDFANTPAFLWLTEHAEDFAFTLSYPENNSYGLAYEPWHWAFRDMDIA